MKEKLTKLIDVNACHTAYDKRVLYPHAERDSQRRAVHHSFHRGDIILLWRTDGKKIWR